MIIENINIPFFIFVFFGQLIYNFGWAFCVRNVATGNKSLAAATSGFNTFLSAILTISFVENKIYIIPLTFGAVIGTYLAMLLKFHEKN